MDKLFEQKLKNFFKDMKDPAKKKQFENFYKSEIEKQIKETNEVFIIINKRGSKKIIKAEFKDGKAFVNTVDLTMMDMIFLVYPLLDLITKETLKGKEAVLNLYNFIKGGFKDGKA